MPYSILPEQRIPLGNPKPTPKTAIGTRVTIVRPPWDRKRRKHIGHHGTIVGHKGFHPIIELESGERICADEHFWKRRDPVVIEPTDIVATVKQKLNAERLTKVDAVEYTSSISEVTGDDE